MQPTPAGILGDDREQPLLGLDLDRGPGAITGTATMAHGCVTSLKRGNGDRRKPGRRQEDMV